MGCTTKPEYPKLDEAFPLIDQEVLNNSRAYPLLEQATTDIGHRLTGTANGAKAEQFTYALLKEWQLENVHFFEFEAVSWMRESVSLDALVGDEARNIDVVSLAHSPVSADVKAPLIDVGNGLKADFERLKDSIPGKVVLMNLGLEPKGTKGNLHRSEKSLLAIEHGAAGIIFKNGVQGQILLTGTASVTGDLIPIPAVCASFENGDSLRTWLKEAPFEVQIKMENHSDKIKARNVIAEIKGSELPDEYICVGGHLDSWDLATGAIDNGIGSFSVLDIARTMQALKLKLPLKRSLRFIMFMGEEEGLLGSKAYVEHLVETGEIKNVVTYINLDMAGNPVGFNASGRDELVPLLDTIGTHIARVDTVFKNKLPNRAGLHSDHQPFMEEGVPVIAPASNMKSSIYGCYHSSCDDFGLVDKTAMVNNVRFVSMLMYGVANCEDFPAKHMTSEQVGKFLEKQGLREKLELGKDWRWGL